MNKMSKVANPFEAVVAKINQFHLFEGLKCLSIQILKEVVGDKKLLQLWYIHESVWRDSF